MTEEVLFGGVDEFPSQRAADRFSSLVGIDDIKNGLVAQVRTLLDPSVIASWSESAHGALIPAAADMINRTALIVLEGDVGSGKTELAETIGEPVAQLLGVKVTLFPLSLSARGHGAVGEMTSLLTSAFEKVRENAVSGRSRDGKLRHATILLVDEADALAQSRELAQMHHEDRAGVNALIRGVDGLRNDHLPVITIMCTNRIDALDPAVRRRAAAVFTFRRPDEAARDKLLRVLLEQVTLSDADYGEVVKFTGPHSGCSYGCTYSDIRQRLVPSVVIEAYQRGGPITAASVIAIAKDMVPTRPFELELQSSS